MPVKAISAAEFDARHLNHIIDHAPDELLFPFLHGLEGDNYAQNAFFSACHNLRVPRFRGLVWVATDGDDEFLEFEHGIDDEDDDIDYSDCDEDERRDDDEEDDYVDLNAMDIDSDDHTPHMHPVAHRAPLSVQTQGNHPPRPASSHSSASSSSSSLDQGSPLFASTDSTCPSPATSFAASELSPNLSDLKMMLPSAPSSDRGLSPEQEEIVTSPPVLTSSFRAKELLRWDENGQPEFVPPKVPAGVSLRNFGIQVPIYATISDIVVYSPTGNLRAARRLAERFAIAVDKKRRQRERAIELRRQRLRIQFGPDACEPSSSTNDADDKYGLLNYDVYVLTASPREIRKTLPHLVSTPFQPGQPIEIPSATSGLSAGNQQPQKDAKSETENVPGAFLRTGSAPAELPTEMTTRECQNDDGVVLSSSTSTSRDGQQTASVTTSISECPEASTSSSTSLPSRLVSEFIPWTCAQGLPPPGSTGNTADFAQREKDEMRALTRASIIISYMPSSGGVGGGEVYLGNVHDVPVTHDDELPSHDDGQEEDPFDLDGRQNPRGFDLCLECHELAPFPSSAHLRTAEEHLRMMEDLWQRRRRAPGSPYAKMDSVQYARMRPAPTPGAVVHLPFPSSPPNSSSAVTALLPVLRFFERWLAPPASSSPGSSSIRHHTPARPLKILLHSADGYTESSVPALCLLMALRGLSLPSAYIELQVHRRRSFFVYQGDLPFLRRVESRLGVNTHNNSVNSLSRFGLGPSSTPRDDRLDHMTSGQNAGAVGGASGDAVTVGGYGRPRAKTVPSFVDASPSRCTSPTPVPPAGSNGVSVDTIDHRWWFDDQRFDGSFPSRVLDFLYLGNLNHATNAYMLHALGITHVVSVGECALIPPTTPNSLSYPPTASDPAGPACTLPPHESHGGVAPGTRPRANSLWAEERAGRIKVLDVQNVCDDGIDTLAPQLEPICDWIEDARRSGGQVLVHCRVGVSRSATVTIAYVMKHLGLPLVDAYLLVRSRRLSVLIQPNMRLLYNLTGWEIKLARERAGEDHTRLRKELERTLSWPVLAREVHRLNEKYLH